MITDVVQRWRARRDSYRPAGEPFDPSAHEVERLIGDGSDRLAADFVKANHYSRSYPAARERFALRERGGALVGVAVFSQPVNAASLACLPGDRQASLELGRLVLLDHVRANAETWLLARCFAELRTDGYVGVVSFSDPVPRRTADGVEVFGGHVGTIYCSPATGPRRA